MIHFNVQDVLPESKTVVIGELYAVGAPAEPVDEGNDPEVKVVQRGRRPGRPKGTQVAETK